jgi:NADH oxidase (H2O2-forming)
MALDADRKSVLLQTGNIDYDKLVIATGSKPIKPPIKGMDTKGVFTLKSLEDAGLISKWQGHTAVVIGSGPIGVEASLALKKRGYQVTLVELLDRILPQVFDEYPARFIKDALGKNGINVSTREKVVEISGEGSVERVITDRRKIKCDTVILAAGMRPEKSFAEGVLGQGVLGGIKVNDRMETSLEDVYASGDCVEAQGLIEGRPVLSLLWHNARMQGEVAGSNAAGIPRTYTGSINVTGIEVRGLKAISIGITGSGLVNDPEIIETWKNGPYRRLVFSRDVLIGIQSINWDINIGLCLAAVLRREKWETCQGLNAFGKLLLKHFNQVSFGRRPMRSEG